MPLDLFYTMVQKSQKWPKTQIKGGSCLKSILYSFEHHYILRPNEKIWGNVLKTNSRAQKQKKNE